MFVSSLVHLFLRQGLNETQAGLEYSMWPWSPDSPVFTSWVLELPGHIRVSCMP